MAPRCRLASTSLLLALVGPASGLRVGDDEVASSLHLDAKDADRQPLLIHFEKMGNEAETSTSSGSKTSGSEAGSTSDSAADAKASSEEASKTTSSAPAAATASPEAASASTTVAAKAADPAVPAPEKQSGGSDAHSTKEADKDKETDIIDRQLRREAYDAHKVAEAAWEQEQKAEAKAILTAKAEAMAKGTVIGFEAAKLQEKGEALAAAAASGTKAALGKTVSAAASGSAAGVSGVSKTAQPPAGEKAAAAASSTASGASTAEALAEATKQLQAEKKKSAEKDNKIKQLENRLAIAEAAVKVLASESAKYKNDEREMQEASAKAAKAHHPVWEHTPAGTLVMSAKQQEQLAKKAVPPPPPKMAIPGSQRHASESAGFTISIKKPHPEGGTAAPGSSEARNKGEEAADKMPGSKVEEPPKHESAHAALLTAAGSEADDEEAAEEELELQAEAQHKQQLDEEEEEMAEAQAQLQKRYTQQQEEEEGGEAEDDDEDDETELVVAVVADPAKTTGPGGPRAAEKMLSAHAFQATPNVVAAVPAAGATIAAVNGLEDSLPEAEVAAVHTADLPALGS